MAEKYDSGELWEAVVSDGFYAIYIWPVEGGIEPGWNFTVMELHENGTCEIEPVTDGLDWDDDTPEELRDHEAYFPDPFTAGARILAHDWDHNYSNDEVRSRCVLVTEYAESFNDYDTALDWLCESTMADFTEVEAMTFFQNLTLMERSDIAELGGRPIIPSAGPEECRAAVLAFNQKMIPCRRERGQGNTAVIYKPDPTENTTSPAAVTAAVKKTVGANVSGGADRGGKHI